MSQRDAHGAAWPADWDAVARQQAEAWLRTSAEERLRWLEDALTFAEEVGALRHDRRRRAADAADWSRAASP